MTTSALPTSSALAPLVVALLAEPLHTLDATALQAQIAAVTPQVGRLQGWLHAAAGQLDALTGGSIPDVDTGRPRTVAGGSRRSSTRPLAARARSCGPPGSCASCRWSSRPSSTGCSRRRRRRC